MEKCENCHRAIGALETAHVWQEHVVCTNCFRELDGAQALQTPQMSYRSRDAEQEVRQSKRPVVVKPDFWRDPNVGAVAVFIVIFIFVILFLLAHP